MSSTAATVILNYVCPILGIGLSNYQYLAPLKDLDTAVKNAQGLKSLNPTPWAFMLGNCLGWTAYALLSANPYLFLSDGPGFMISCWLNLGAIKLMYSDHHQKQTKKSLVAFLQTNDIKMEEERKSMLPRLSKRHDYDDRSRDDDDDLQKSKNNNDDNIIPGYDDDEEKGFLERNDSNVFTNENDRKEMSDLQESKNNDDDDITPCYDNEEGKGLERNDSIVFTNENDRKEMSNLQESKNNDDDDITPCYDDEEEKGLERNDSIVFTNENDRKEMSDLQEFSKSNSTRSGSRSIDFTGGVVNNSLSSNKKNNDDDDIIPCYDDEEEKGLERNDSIVYTNEIDRKEMSDLQELKNNDDDDIIPCYDDEEEKGLERNDSVVFSGDTGEKSMTVSMVFSRSKSRMNLFSQKSRKRLGRMKSMANLGESFTKRKQKVNEWGQVVWHVTAQQEPAKAPHEKLLMSLIGLWFVTFTVLGFYCHYAESGDNKTALTVIGWVIMFNKVFFYGAPLSRITTIIRTRKCDSIHLQSLIAITLNASLWAAYGIAVADPFIWVPMVLGLLLSAIQFIMCAIFPRTKLSEDEEKEKGSSITNLLMSQRALGAVRKSVIGDISDTMQENSEVRDESIAEEYMTSYGFY